MDLKKCYDIKDPKKVCLALSSLRPLQRTQLFDDLEKCAYPDGQSDKRNKIEDWREKAEFDEKEDEELLKLLIYKNL